MEDNSEIILDIQVRYDDAISKIQNYRDEINRTKKDQELFRDEFKKGELTNKEYSKAMIETNAVIKQRQKDIRSLEREIQNNIKVENELKGSYNAMSAELSILKSKYKELDEGQRNSQAGKLLKDQINETNDKLKELDAGIGVFSREVGNYEASILKAASGNNSFALSLLEASTKGKGFGGMIDTIKTKTSAFFKVLLANPVIAILAAVIAILASLKKAINSSEEATDRWNKILAPFQLLMDKLLLVLQNFVSVLLSGVEAIGKFAMSTSRLLEKLPLVGKYMKEANDEIDRSIQLQQQKNDLEKTEREAMVQNAKNANEIAKLRAKAEDKSQYTAEQRLEFIRQANKVELQQSEISKNLAQQRLSIAEEEAKRNENSVESERELSRLRAEAINAETQYFENTRSLIRKEQSFLKEIRDDEKKSADERQQRANEYASLQQELRDNEIQAVRTYEDSLTSLITNELKRQEREVRLSYDRQIEDLRLKLKTEKNLTETARLNLSNTILNLEQQREDALNKLTIDNMNKEAETRQKNIALRLEAIRSETYEALKLRMESLEIERDTALRNAEQTGEDRKLINDKYRKLINDENLKAEKQANDAILKEQQLYLENKISQARLNNENTLQLELEQKQFELESIKQLDEESDNEFLARKLAIQQAIKDKQDEIASHQIELNNIILESYGILFGSLSDFLSEFAENSELLSEFSKALALFEISLNTAKALSAGIAAAQSVGFPANLAAIATTTAAILSNIAKAKKLLSSEKEPKAPKFSKGGLVTGSGSGTSDSINAKLSNGESVMTARATAMFSPVLSAFNRIGGGVPISTQDTSSQTMGEEMLTRAFARAVMSLPNPVVSVQEINSVNDSIEAKELFL